MSGGLEIQCPQPTRPLKRKAAQLEATDQRGYREPARKRTGFWSPTESITNWLGQIPPPCKRKTSRSDSFLLRKMNGPSQPSRPGSAQPNTNKQPTYQPLSPLSLSRTATTFPPPARVPYPPNSAVPSAYSAASQQTVPSRTSTSNSRDDPKKSKRVQSPTYRDELKHHSIYIDSYGMSMPDTVRNYAQNIIQKKRGSPPLTDQEVAYTREQLSTLDNADEEITRTGFAKTPLFPTIMDYKVGPNKYSIAEGANIPFDRTALPYITGSRCPPVVTPIPDFHYGFPYESFNSQISDVVQHPRLYPYAKPTSAAYWPFFAIEYKSPSRLGSRWVAANQNAGTGSHCVNSIETLLSYTRTREQRQITDSVAFSCVVDSHDASLWVHWREHGNGSHYVSSEIDFYHFHRPQDIRHFRSSVRNIIDFGLDERLPMIKSALFDLIPQLPIWDEEDKVAKARRFSQLDDGPFRDGSDSRSGSRRR